MKILATEPQTTTSFLGGCLLMDVPPGLQASCAVSQSIQVKRLGYSVNCVWQSESYTWLIKQLLRCFRRTDPLSK
jgi:hypothetical protein